MIPKNRFRLRLCIALTVCNLIFIWGNSLLPAHISAAISTFVRNVIAFFFPGEGTSDPNAGHGLLRKIAHVLEFCSLGALLCWLLTELRKKRLFSLLGGFLAACIDESIQLFVPGRGPHIQDVFIDTLGVIAGFGVFTIFHTFYKNKKQNLEDK